MTLLWALVGLAAAADGWAVRESKSKMDDSPIVIVRREAIAPVMGFPSNSQTPALVLRCADGEVEAFVVTGLIAQPEYGRSEKTTTLRIDDHPPFTAYAEEATSSDTLFLPEPRSLIEKLMRAKRLRFRFTPYNSPPQIAEFRLEGLTAAIEPLLRACNWRTAAHPTFTPTPSPTPDPATVKAEQDAIDSERAAAALVSEAGPLVGRLHAGTEAQRLAAAERLGALAYAAAIPALSDTIASDPSKTVRDAAARALLAMRGEHALRLLNGELVMRRDPLVRKALEAALTAAQGVQP